MKTLNRRDFIKGVAALSTAAVCSVAAGNAFADEEKPAETAVQPDAVEPAAPTEPGQTPKLPWGKYQELDPEYVRKLGHLGYYLQECAGGAFWGIMTALKEKAGYPYTTIPLPTMDDFMANIDNKKHGLQVPMSYGAGGVAGFGTLCGAPNGAACAITYILPMEQAEKLIQRLLRYYEVEEFPTKESNDMAVNHEFYPKKMKSDKALLRSASDSVLCHVSVGKWCEKSGYASGSKERAERCGRITGDIAAMAVKMLNAHMKGELDAVFPMKLSHDTVGCMTCHDKGEKFETGQFTRGKMDCGDCHDEKMEPHRGPNTLKTAYGTDVTTFAGAAVIGTIAGIGAHAVNKRITKGKNDDEE